MQTQSVLICLPGQSQMRVLVPAFEPTGQGAEKDAVETLKAFLEVPSSQWLPRIFETNLITEVENNHE